jgi:hypothetical protein
VKSAPYAVLARLVFVLSASSLAACGLALMGTYSDGNEETPGAEAGSGSSGASGADGRASGSSGTSGSSTSSGGSSSSGSSSSSSSGGGACPAAPSGWAHVGVPADPQTPCPSGDTQEDLVDHVVTAPGVCACTCAISQHQSCANGNYDTYYDQGDGKCGTKASGQLSNSPAGGCDDQGFTFSIGPHFKATPPGPTGGGSCSATVNLDSSKITKVAARLCSPASASDCAAAPLADCIVSNGDLACPAGPYATKRSVSGDVGVTCGSCGACSVSTTCKGTIVFGGTSSCNGPSVPADNTCYPVPNTTNLRYARYTGTTAGESCTYGTSSPAPVLAPTGVQTVCCR